MKRLLSTLILLLMLQTSALFAQQTYTLTLRTSPQAIAGFGTSYRDNTGWPHFLKGNVQKLPAGYDITVELSNSYYLLGPWKVKEWRTLEGSVNFRESYDSNRADFTMPAENVTLVAVMEYNPDNPENPMPNGWYPDEGLLVIDNDMATYSDPIARLIGDPEDYTLVTKYIQGGYILYPDRLLDMLSGELFPSLRSVDLSRCNGITEISNLKERPWKELILPSSVKFISSDAFYGTFIESLTLFAATPPQLMDYAFPSESDMTVFVPQDALPLYQADEMWNKYTLRPIIENAANVTVKVLPDAPLSDLVPYYGMTLELQNVKSLETRHMLITSRHDYVFRTLPTSTVYHVRLLNRSGDVVAHAENIYLKDDDVSVVLNSLRPVCSLQLRVQADSKVVPSDAYSVLWIDNNGNVTGSGSTVDGILGDEPLKMIITITDAELRKTYISRDTMVIDKPAEQALPHYVHYNLRPLPIRQLTTTVLRDDGEYMGLHDVSQRIYRVNGADRLLVCDTTFNSPTLHGDFPYQGLTTANPVLLPDGNYELSVVVDGANLQDDSRSLTLSRDTTLTFRLHEVNGSVIKASWAHYSVADLDADIATARCINKRISEASLTIFDQTNRVEVKGFAVTADNMIRLQERLEPGTKLDVTLGNRDGLQFDPVTLSGTIDAEGNMSLDFVTRDYGTLVVQFDETECPHVAIKVFDEDGRLAAGTNDTGWQNNRTAFPLLKDGSYRVVLMESGMIASAMNTLEDVQKFLQYETDCTQADVEVESGKTTMAIIPTVPVMSDDIHLYTDDYTTRITPKRTTMTAGALQTISAQVDFQPEYKGRVSQLKAIFSVPENDEMHFVEGSVIINNDKASYNRTEGELEVDIIEGRLLRFCVVPTGGGKVTINGRIRFLLDGEEHEQPLPSTSFEVENMSIRVLRETATETAPICGTAVPNTQVTIVVNGSPVGSTMSDNNGDWTFECPINNSYNMCVNNIYAQYTGYGGFLVKTPEKQVTFNRYGIRVDKVTMTWHPLPSNNPYYHSLFPPSVVQFDYLTNSVKPKGYTVISGPSVVDFEVELATSDTTFIDDVIVHVETNKGDEHAVHAKYYSGKRWYASRQYGTDEYPVNVGAEVRHHAPQTLGNEGLTGRLRYWDDFLEESKSRKATTSELCQALENTEIGSEAEKQAMYNLMRHAGIAQESYLEAYEKNKDKPDFNPEQPDPANPYFPGYTETYYPEGEAGLNMLTQDINDTEQDLNALIETYNLNGDGWNLPDSYNYNQLGEIYPGYTISRISAETRMHFENIRSRRAQLSNGEDGYYDYEVPTETGNGVFMRVGENGYRLVILDEDVQVDVNLNAANPELAATLNELRQIQAEARRLLAMAPNRADDAFIQRMHEMADQLADAMLKLANTLGAYWDWLDKGASMSHQAYRDTKAQGLRMWRRYTDVERRGFAGTVQGKDLLKRCKINGILSARKLDELADLQQFFERMRVTKALGPIFGALNLYSDFNDMLDAIAQLEACYYMVPMICKDDQAAANKIRFDLVIWGEVRVIQKATASLLDIASLTEAIAGLMSAPATAGTGTLFGGALSLATSVFTWVGSLAFDWAYQGFFDGIRTRIEKLKCIKDPKDKYQPKIGPATPLVDPSGYVYEAVPSNRVPSAIASVYCKDTYEDVYGDEHERVTLWDGESFGYENPQLTDENGEYGWDVPAGQWQVRVTKDGYRPVSSEWLPVPPPQLDVNLELQQPSAPEVQRVIASEQGVQIDFDKYMKPAHLTGDNIFLTKNGEKVAGAITLLNAEATADQSKTFASRLLFKPEGKLNNGEQVRLTVKAGIESYANVPMLNDYTQDFDVEPRVSELVADAVPVMKPDEKRLVTVTALPAIAAAGKRVLIASQNKNVVDTDVSEVTLDANGQATFTLQSKAYGTTTVTLTLADDADVKLASNIRVVDEDGLVTEAPEASRVSGTAVESGATVRLSCATPNAVIYYTLDESCPCDNPQRLVYDGPITINSNMTLNAMAIAPGYTESEVVTYIYMLKGTGVEIVTTAKPSTNGQYYDLQGRRVTPVNSQLQKGIYIVDGEKRVVK